jgi:hypothetical protein
VAAAADPAIPVTVSGATRATVIQARLTQDRLARAGLL